MFLEKKKKKEIHVNKKVNPVYFGERRNSQREITNQSILQESTIQEQCNQTTKEKQSTKLKQSKTMLSKNLSQGHWPLKEQDC